MKRVICVCLLAVIGSLVLVGCGAAGSGSGESRELYVLQFGGAYEDVLRANAAEFEEAYDAKVVFVQAAAMDALIKAKNKEIDVVFSDPIYAFRGEREGLWEILDEDLVPNLKNLYQSALLSEYTVAHDFGANIIAYNPKYVTEIPDSWLDLWKPEYKDKVIARSFRGAEIDLLFLMAELHGGDQNNLDPGFKKMAELARNNIHTWFKDHPQGLDLFRSEQAWLGIWTDGRVNWAKDEGVNVEMAVPKEGAFPLTTTMNVVAGRPNNDLAQAYINFELSKGPQLTVAEKLGYFPLNKEVKIPPDVQAKCAYNPDNVEGVNQDHKRFVESMMDELNARWEKEVLGAR
mgnify:CR=1 FL=1